MVFSLDFVDVNLITYVVRDSSLICMWSISKIPKCGHLNETAFVRGTPPWFCMQCCTRWFQLSSLRMKSQSVTNQNKTLCMSVLSCGTFCCCASEPSKEGFYAMPSWCAGWYKILSPWMILSSPKHVVQFVVLYKVVLTFWVRGWNLKVWKLLGSTFWYLFWPSCRVKKSYYITTVQLGTQFKVLDEIWKCDNSTEFSCVILRRRVILNFEWVEVVFKCDTVVH